MNYCTNTICPIRGNCNRSVSNYSGFDGSNATWYTPQLTNTGFVCGQKIDKPVTVSNNTRLK